MRAACRVMVLLLCLCAASACGAPRTRRACGILYTNVWPGGPSYLRLLEPDSGVEHTLLTTQDVRFDGGLSPDGTQALYRWRHGKRWGETWIMPLDGSRPGPLARSATPLPSRGEGWSFDGRKAAFSASVEDSADGCRREYYVVDVASDSVSKLPVCGWAAAWSPRDERIAILCRFGEEWGVCAIDTDTGQTRRLVQGKYWGEAELGEAELAWSPDAKQIAIVGGLNVQEYLLLVDVESGAGRAVNRSDAYRRLRALSWSPEGDRIAFVAAEPRRWAGFTYALVVLDVRTGEECRLVEVEGEMWGPLIWSPDGRQIAFDGPSGDRSYGCISTVDVATGQVTQLADEPEPHEILAWGWVTIVPEEGQ